MSTRKTNVNIFLRNPNKLGNFSLEIFYNELYKELVKSVNLKIINVPYKNRGIFGRIYNIIFCYFNQTDVNHIVGDIAYCSLLMKKKKLVITILDCVSLYGKNDIKKTLLKYFLYSMPVKRASQVITISEATKFDVEKFLNKKFYNSTVIPVTVSSTFFSKKIKESNTRFNNRFLMLGTAPNKNIERVSQALEGINGELHIIGKLSKSQKNQLLKSKIKFIEYSYPLTEEEIVHQYSLTDILIFPSILEGFGMPIIEGNLMNVPVITSEISSMPYVAGNSAILVDPFSISSIRDGINSIINDKKLRDNLIILGKKNSKRFTIKKISSQHLNVYNKI